MTNKPIRVVVLPRGFMEGLLAEQAVREESEENAARLTEGTLRTSWSMLEWAKAQMNRRAN